MTENEMVGWHQRFNGHEFEQIPGDSEGQGSLAVHGITESDMTQWLNNNKQGFLNLYRVTMRKEMATHSSILAWEIPWTEEPGECSHGVAKSKTQLSD